MTKSFVLGFWKLGFNWSLDIGIWDFKAKTPSFGKGVLRKTLKNYRQSQFVVVQAAAVEVPE